MQFNETKIFLEQYHHALLGSIQDESWLANSVNYPEIFKEYFNTKKNIDVIGVDCTVEDLIEYKNKNNIFHINNDVMNFAQNKSKYLIDNINSLYQKTSYFANIVSNLLNEFASNTRHYDCYKISPLPENLSDTYLPIIKFKMICNNGECKAKIIRGGMKVTNHEKLSDYFNKRIISKFLKTAYLPDLPDEKEYRKRLLFMKSVPLEGIKILSKKPSKYKLMYLGNQTVAKDEHEFSITDEPIDVLSIRKL